MSDFLFSQYDAPDAYHNLETCAPKHDCQDCEMTLVGAWECSWCGRAGPANNHANDYNDPWSSNPDTDKYWSK